MTKRPPTREMPPLGVLALLAWVVFCGSALAQSPGALEAQRDDPSAVVAELLAGPPVDVVVVRGGEESTPLELLPLELDGRRVPDPLPESGVLSGRLIDRPQVEIEIAYANIERIELYEARLLAEAEAATAAGRFEDVYDLLQRLSKDYPDLPGLDRVRALALRTEALARFRSGENVHALALLETLHATAPKLRGLREAVDRVADAAIAQRVAGGDYGSIRASLDALDEQFAGLELRVGTKWQARLEDEAARLRAEAVRLAERDQPRAAMRAAKGAAALLPGSAETRRLVERLTTQTGELWVGVSESAASDATPRLDAPAALRQAELVGGRVARLVDYSDTGGAFRCRVGEIETDASRRRLTVRFAGRSAADGGARLARALLTPAIGALEPLSLLRSRTLAVSVAADASTTVELRTAHPLPTALLASIAPDGLADAASGDWRRVPPREGSDASARYERRFASGAYRAVVEFVYEPVAALDALRRGELNAVASVPPWRVGQFESTPGVRVVPCRLPRVHVLLISPDSPLAASRESRRAIDYALARRQTVDAVLLGGESRPGFEPLSGPFPRGLSLSDPLRYAYDDRLEPRPYEPRLAALLIASARAAEAKRTADAEEDGAAAPAQEQPLRLAHTPTPLARRAVAAIVGQLEAIGMAATPVEASEADLLSGAVEYDLRYAELTFEEPMVDAWRLLGPDGVAGDCSPAVRSLLDQLHETTTGADAASVLRELHRLTASELPMIPLWQTVDHFAFRSDLGGVAERPVTFYQAIDAWRPAAGRSR